ncbi:hypothetical protein M885DRAFT_522476 [Pelagophyceae sp. CCMP2097]|nr:hypothetical protein M885DRAFT_522476 [Pelagophyceae sp. CCMP2097]|mmetsp:Transcript_32236/g.110918  ORF Transcript_32236/g.110918 Transcript_32236/m.110918 type:complete len:899 (-) Transcript_32236:83-2779(-)
MVSSQSDLTKAAAEAAVEPNLDGLTTAEADALMVLWGPNSVPKIEVPLWKLFGRQFVGTMPVMLELAAFAAFAVADFTDAGVLLSMVILNSCLGFHEQLKAKEALDELTDRLEAKVSVKRDGKTQRLDVSQLVPGDIIYVCGGDQVPADVEWLKGDTLPVDTAALTGESMPRKYPSAAYGREIMSGCTVMAGGAYCRVHRTGLNTEMGESMAAIAADRAGGIEVSVFEQRVLTAMQYIIAATVLIVAIVCYVDGVVRDNFFNGELVETVLIGLSIIIAAIPIALPLILQVTMAIGAGTMARDHSSIVTRTAALQDIAAMEVLCSDKTGTLTTAKMSVLVEKSVAFSGFTQREVLQFARLSANVDKAEDPIDRAVCAAYDAEFVAGGADDVVQQYSIDQEFGFNAELKRMVMVVTKLADGSEYTISKGLVSKVLDTANDGADSGELQWQCADYAAVSKQVSEADFKLSKAGYKTIAVAVRKGDGPMEFCGLLPMLDPPRFDTMSTIESLNGAGVEVKMITGDHLNVAKETCRLIGLDAIDVFSAESCRGADVTTSKRIRQASGFAQVLPRDKREIVQRLQTDHDLIVGMTGDGVNDAPALSAAQCGIAVDGATDAAKNAAAIVLTSPGLSAIFGAVVESRKIFARLRSYITYRFAATIHVVSYLSILSLAYRCQVKPLFVIILALANDLSMMPVAEDNAIPAAMPVKPEVAKMLGLAATYGFVMCGTSLIFYTLITTDGLLSRGEDLLGPPGGHALCSQYVQSAVFLQISIIAELLIFSTRAPNTFFFLSKPSYALMTTTFLASVIATILTVEVTGFGDLTFSDVCGIWAFDFVVILICDISKLGYNKIFISDDTFACMPGMGGDEKNPLDMLKKMSSGNLTEQPTASTPLLAKTAGNV